MRITSLDRLTMIGRYSTSSGVDGRDLVSGLERTSVPRLRGRIANYDDVAAQLRHTRWAVLLD